MGAHNDDVDLGMLISSLMGQIGATKCAAVCLL